MIVTWLLVTMSEMGLLVLHALLDVQLELTTPTIHDPSWFYEYWFDSHMVYDRRRSG